MGTCRIIALDLGKFKTVACVMNALTNQVHATDERVSNLASPGRAMQRMRRGLLPG